MLGSIGVLVVILLIASAGWLVVRSLTGPDGGGGSASVLRIAPVTKTTPGACPSGGPGVAAVDGRTCYRLGESAMTVHRLDRAEARLDPSGKAWSITVSFNDDDARRFTQLTRKYVHRQLALVSNGKVLAAPTVQEPISGGDLQISGDFSADQAKKIAAGLPT